MTRQLPQGVSHLADPPGWDSKAYAWWKREVAAGNTTDGYLDWYNRINQTLNSMHDTLVDLDDRLNQR